MIKPSKLNFGTSGIPLRTENPSTENGIKKVHELGLDAMELEFVRNVNINENKAPEIKKIAEKEDVVLTCHGQYYVNLNAELEEKIEASKNRIMHAAKIAYLCGAYSVCFHAAYYMKQEPKLVYDKVKEALKDVTKKLKDKGYDIWIRPETTGRRAQFGTLEEILKLSQEIENVMPCIDFSHLHARTKANNTHEEFNDLLGMVEKALGREGLNNMHIHLSGINYGDKGEKNHLNLRESDMNYADLLNVFKAFKIKGVIIGESPNVEVDALFLKKEFGKIKE